jgi:hypothetical protein
MCLSHMEDLGNHYFHYFPIHASFVWFLKRYKTEVPNFMWETFLGAFTKLRKATVSFIVSVCPFDHPSVCLRATTLVPLDGFSLNLISDDFLKIFQENSCFIISEENNGSMKVNIRFYHISFSSYVWDRSCWQNQKVHFMFNNLYQILRHLWDNEEKDCRTRRDTWQYCACPLHAGYISIATVVAQTRLSVALCIHCLSCRNFRCWT